MDINTEREIELAFNEFLNHLSQNLEQTEGELKTEQAASMDQ